MCGILAILCDDKPKDLKKILNSIQHIQERGPDGTTSIIKNNGIYVFSRLAINDVSEKGNQPMVNKNGVILMCNGEIYNFKELIEEYQLDCSSHSDCEVILKLYEKFGFEETIHKLYGVFAIVLIDNDKVYIARDRIGVRPLFTCRTKEGYLCIGSTPTIFRDWGENIESFSPGTIAMYDKNYPQFYWQILNYLKYNIANLETANIIKIISLIKTTLITSVEKRLVSDRPIACLLSGGLDSSIITTILVKLLGANKVRTYSVGMTGSTDLKYARLLANALGTEHHEIFFEPKEAFDCIPEVVKQLGTYDITTIRASVGMYLVSKYISKYSKDKVIFSGEGSDELLCGYLYFHNCPGLEELQNESIHLIRNLHKYDVLRADRMVSCHGLELRVPFLDRDMVDLCISIPPVYKNPKFFIENDENDENTESIEIEKNMEKYILRLAFEDILPDEIVWRRKEGFSDGVSSMEKPWYSHIQDYVNEIIPDNLFNSYRYPSKEAMYYNLLFEHYFPTYNLKIDYWLPKWTDQKDPSGRLIKIS